MVQRYGTSCMPRSDGVYVRHSDYEVLEAECERLRAALRTPLLTGADAPMYGGIFAVEGINREVVETAFYAGAHTVTIYYGERRVFTSMAEFYAAHPKEQA